MPFQVTSDILVGRYGTSKRPNGVRFTISGYGAGEAGVLES